MYNVKVKRRTLWRIEQLPRNIQDMFFQLVEDLREFGPVQPTWPNYGRLADDVYHCHLKYRYVVCWRHEKGTVTIEVYYVGRRENAPY